jgi:carboxyl-terminal processing protease
MKSVKKHIISITALLLALLIFVTPVLAVPSGGVGRLELLREIKEMLEDYALYIGGVGSLAGITPSKLEADDDLFWEIVASWQADDPYGIFYSTDDYEARFGGSVLYGIGIKVDVSMPLGVYVEDFLPGGGAGAGGMEVGAQVVFVDGVNIADEVYMEIRPLFLGEKQSDVEIGYINPGSSEVIYETIRRSALTTDNVEGYMIDGTDVGYISVGQFSSMGDVYFYDKYFNDVLPGMGAKSVIIDLRGNPGGLLDAVTDMLKLTIPEKGLLLHTQVSAEGEEHTYSTGSSDAFLRRYSGKIWQPEQIAVLIDGDSGSASEIFAGTMQAHGLAVIVGETSYGKSHSQYHTFLSTSDMLVFTVSRIDLHKIGCYEGAGIIPDHILENSVKGSDAGMRKLDTSRALFRQSVLTERIIAAQERLAALGYYRTEPSGIFDCYTLWALNRFQAAHELDISRFANVKTLQKLDMAAMEAKIWEDVQLQFAIDLLINP